METASVLSFVVASICVALTLRCAWEYLRDSKQNQLPQKRLQDLLRYTAFTIVVSAVAAALVAFNYGGASAEEAVVVFALIAAVAAIFQNRAKKIEGSSWEERHSSYCEDFHGAHFEDEFTLVPDDEQGPMRAMSSNY